MRHRQESGSRLHRRGPSARAARVRTGALAVAGLLTMAAVAAAQTPEPFEISDNSFLVEEALNQEPGIFQNILSFRRDRGGDWDLAFTQEWPVVTRRHQLSYTLPFAGRANETGVGDVFIHYRLQVFDGEDARPAFSPRLSLILPTGSASRGLGNGNPGWELNLPFSKQVGDVYLHWNAGMTHLPAAEIGAAEHNLLTPRLAASAIWRARPMLNLLFETVVDWEEQVLDEISSRNAAVTFVPGFRTGWNIGDTQTIVGLGVPVVVDDGDANAGVFLYFSYELPFRK